MIEQRRTISIESYDENPGRPVRFAAYEAKISLINPLVEAYAIEVDGHYILKTRVKGEETADLGVVELDKPKEASRRLLGMLSSRLLGERDVTYRFSNTRILDVLIGNR